ncbi:MAG TPA: hypothetical protein VF743_07250 [Acidimicrobiales bacterium]
MITTRRRTSLVALLLLASLGLAACGEDGGGGDGVATLGDDGDAAAADDGGGSDDGGGGQGPSPEQDAELQDAMLEYAQCMRDHGIDMPDPEFGDGGATVRMVGPAPGPDGGPSEEFEAADEACHHIIEAVEPDIDLDPEEQAELQDRMVAFAECMRERGHDMPDPEVDGEGRVTMRAPRAMDSPGEGPDEDFERDAEACNDEAGMGEDGGPGLVVGGGA